MEARYMRSFQPVENSLLLSGLIFNVTVYCLQDQNLTSTYLVNQQNSKLYMLLFNLKPD